MAKGAKVDPPPFIYVDSCVYVDLLIERQTPHADTGKPRAVSAAQLFTAISSGQVRLAGSALIEAEVGCNGETGDDAADVRAKIDGWLSARSTELAEIDRHLARRAVDLLAEWRPKCEKRMGSGDALHLAAAVELGCDYLFTHDTGFPIGHSVEGTQVQRPSEVWPTYLDFEP